MRFFRNFALMHLHEFMPKETSKLGQITSPFPQSISTQDMSHTASKRRRVYLETYGCQMNVNDTEIVRSILLDNEFIMSETPESADISLLMTCAIREHAETKIWERLKYLKSINKKL